MVRVRKSVRSGAYRTHCNAAPRGVSLAAVLLLTAMLVAGCVGSKIPSEQILRIAPRQAAAVQTNSTGSYAHRFGGPLILMENFESFPALDRSAVMVARGNVLTPSTRWYWEGAPASIATASIASALQSSPEYTLVWPARNRQEHQAVLTGRVESFEVREQESEMVISLRMALWTERGKVLLLTRSVDVHEPLSAMTPQAIADAASKGMASASQAVGAWLKAEGLQAIAAQH
ncbi:MAG: ABC-type transport auxiliary lipoprotein family protein [Halodesulfovibrio sp.]